MRNDALKKSIIMLIFFLIIALNGCTFTKNIINSEESRIQTNKNSLISENTTQSALNEKLSITFPVNEEGKNENNADIYNVSPFSIFLELPPGWGIDEKIETHEYDILPVFSKIGIVNQSGRLIGVIGYNIYKKYEGAEDEPSAIYNQIALGNAYHFDVRNTYEVIKETVNGTTALSPVYYAATINNGLEKENFGILSYNKNYLVYIAMEISREEAADNQIRDIANSIEWN